MKVRVRGQVPFRKSFTIPSMAKVLTRTPVPGGNTQMAGRRATNSNVGGGGGESAVAGDGAVAVGDTTRTMGGNTGGNDNGQRGDDNDDDDDCFSRAKGSGFRVQGSRVRGLEC